MSNRSGQHNVSLIVIAIIFLWLRADGSTTQAQDQFNGTLYFNTLDGAIYVWNIRSPNISLIVDYNNQFDGPSGWSSVIFSDNGHRVAYVRTDGDMRWVGVSALDEWKPVEFAIDVRYDFEKVQLNWLPNNRQVVVSYLIDIPQGPRQPAMYNTLVGRQLLDIGEPGGGLINWPYNCSELVVLSSGEPLLQCNLNADLGEGSASLPPKIGYDFARGELLPHFEGNSTLPIPVQDYIYPNWVWSEQGGLAFFDDGSHNVPNGVNLIPLGKIEPQHLETPATLFGDISWSSDGSRLLVQDNDLRVWHAYDTSNEHLIATLEITDLVFQAGVIWFQDSNHIAFVTEEGQQNAVYVTSLKRDEDFIVMVDASVTSISCYEG